MADLILLTEEDELYVDDEPAPELAWGIEPEPDSNPPIAIEADLTRVSFEDPAVERSGTEQLAFYATQALTGFVATGGNPVGALVAVGAGWLSDTQDTRAVQAVADVLATPGRFVRGLVRS